MLRSLEDELTLLINSLEKMINAGFSERETMIARLSFRLGECAKELEVVQNRKLFEGADNAEKEKQR